MMSINQNLPFERADPDENGKSNLVFFENFSDLKMEPFQSSQYYYLRLKQGKEEKQRTKGKEDSKNPLYGKGNKRGTSGSEELDKWLDSDEEGQLEDWHSLWKNLTKDLSPSEKEFFKQQMQDSIKRVAEETEKNRGTVPSHIKNAIAENFKKKPPTVSWKSILSRFIGSTLSSDFYSTRKRPNFRFEEAPVNKHKTKINIVVGMDSSGSVSDKELQDFFSETNHMWKAGAKIHICIWDAAVHNDYEYRGENHYSRVCQGGTHASSFIQYVNENYKKHNWTCAINLTDGYIESEPIECKLPILWIITSGGSLEFKHSGKKIKMV